MAPLPISVSSFPVPLFSSTRHALPGVSGPAQAGLRTVMTHFTRFETTTSRVPRPCLERPSRRSLGLPRAEGPV